MSYVTMSAGAPPVALVTGASSGFGLLTCLELSHAGFRVFAGLRDLSRSAALDAAAAKEQVVVDKVVLDVTQPTSIEAVVAAVKERAGHIDVLVNNAGFGMAGFLEDLDMGELREQYETNFFGLVAVIKAVVPMMRTRGSGRIINVSSIGGRVATPGLSAYCSSKFAVEGLSESLRYELKPYGVYVALVEPGTFKTDIFGRNRRQARRSLDPTSPYHKRTKHMEALVEKLLARSTADPRKVARTIARVATAKRPRLRYLVGKDAQGEALAKALVPEGLFEAAVLKYVGSPE
jgi:NAD(P)-dependent dehydrogenase (short-subunit alcohol dehydrogenase family)